MSASKIKGSSFERMIANTLSERFADATGLQQAFRRATDSGSFFGASNAKRLLTMGSDHAQFGDILCPRNFRFVLECKRYSSPPTFASIIKQNNAQLDKWLDQVDADAQNAGKIAALIVKFDHCPTIVFLNEGWNIEPMMIYKERIVITLDQWLAQPDHHFFGYAEDKE